MEKGEDGLETATLVELPGLILTGSDLVFPSEMTSTLPVNPRLTGEIVTDPVRPSDAAVKSIGEEWWRESLWGKPSRVMRRSWGFLDLSLNRASLDRLFAVRGPFKMLLSLLNSTHILLRGASLAASSAGVSTVRKRGSSAALTHFGFQFGGQRMIWGEPVKTGVVF